MATMFAAYPAPFVHEERGGKRIQQLLWGDWVDVRGTPADGWVEVRARNTDGWMRTSDLQEDRLLEVCFVDVGQGDGAFIVTPDDRKLLVDAGEGDNMFWFLRWRFNLRTRPRAAGPIQLDHAVITHPDLDHYLGMRTIVDSPQLAIGTLHHNGLVERKTPDDRNILGATEKVDGRIYHTDVIATRAALDGLLAPERVGRMRYPGLMRKALDSDLVGDIRMLSSRDGHLEDYGDGQPLRIEVLGPVPEDITVNGAPQTALRRLGDDGVTKNGHSVVLRLHIGEVRILLGGDLNGPSQRYLLDHYAGPDPDGLVGRARKAFESDVAKACHHGSSEVEDDFLAAVNPLANVISSGDNEQHAHPRPDLIGALGRYGRGNRPLVFSTELARSPNEAPNWPSVLQALRSKWLEEQRDALNRGETVPDEIPGGELYRFQRAIAVYGMINLRTDGTKILLAQKLERRRGNGAEFDYHCIERPEGGGELSYVGSPD